MAAFFGLAAAAANNRAANANVYVGTPQVPGLENKLGSTATTPKDSPKDQKFNADDSPANDELPPAGDYTRFDAKVYSKELYQRPQGCLIEVIGTLEKIAHAAAASARMRLQPR